MSHRGSLLKKYPIYFLIFLLLFSFTSVSAQIITRIVKAYVLIDTDTGVGELNEKVNVYRLIDNDVVSVGQVEILKFQAGKAGAKISKLYRGFQIKIGDFVSTKKPDPVMLGGAYSGKSMTTQKQPMTQTQTGPATRRTQTDRLGIHVGRFLPGSHIENIYVNSFSLGAYFKLVDVWNHSFFVDINYPIFKQSTNVDNEQTTSLILAHLVDHIRVGGRIHFDLGGGAYYKSTKEIATGITGTGTYLGFFVGFSMDFFSQAGLTFSPMLRYHTYHEGIRWNEFVIGGVNVAYSF
jgi:hypothetical protein